MSFVTKNHDAFESATAAERQRIEAEDRRLLMNGARERRGLPSLEQEAQRRAIVERQNEARRSWAEQQQEQPQRSQPTAVDEDAIAVLAKKAAMDWQAMEPSYYPTRANSDMIVAHCIERNLDPTDPKSYATAFAALRDRLERPKRAVPTTTVVEPAVGLNEGKTFCTDGVYRTEKELDRILEQDDEQYRRLVGLNRGAHYRVVRSPLGFESIEDLNQ